MESRIRAVVLDWAGTSVDPGSRAPVAAFIEAFRRRGVEVSEAEARGPMGMAKRDHIVAMLAEPAVARRWAAAHGAAHTEADVDAIYDDMLPALLRVVADHAAPVDGVPKAVAAVRGRGVRVGSTTGYPAEVMAVVRPIAAAAGYEPESVVCASDGFGGRPAPWMLFETARRFDVYPLAAVVKIDDTVTGVEAGRNASAWSVGVAATGNLAALGPDEARRRLEAAGAHLVVDSAAELPRVLDTIEGWLREGRRP